MTPYRMIDLKNREERRKQWVVAEEKRRKDLEKWYADCDKKNEKFELLVEAIADGKPQDELVEMAKDMDDELLSIAAKDMGEKLKRRRAELRGETLPDNQREVQEEADDMDDDE